MSGSLKTPKRPAAPTSPPAPRFADPNAAPLGPAPGFAVPRRARIEWPAVRLTVLWAPLVGFIALRWLKAQIVIVDGVTVASPTLGQLAVAWAACALGQSAFAALEYVRFKRTAQRTSVRESLLVILTAVLTVDAFVLGGLWFLGSLFVGLDVRAD